MTRKAFFILLFIGCSTKQKDMSQMNALKEATSPYLQQHATNPVHWQEWSNEVLNRAQVEDKPILVSIGYSSCHWCHVMEKESFEDTAIASLMNRYFINIKVDREERPDVDQVYMDAVQTMGLRGGWPLNVFLTPDQKPFYGGTYFPKEGWANLLNSIAEAFEDNRDKINESADAFTENLRQKESVKYKLEATDHKLTAKEITGSFDKLSQTFDATYGGINKSPKFPMPAVWHYLTTYYHHTQDQRALDHLIFTLAKIADGGIYDHVGGGFARYSTDEEWHVPHFEKMLYDNGQLLSLYANAYKLQPQAKFEEVILESIEWMKREMLDENGGFYSALDADSEGVEGKFYVWSEAEIDQLLEGKNEWLKTYFDVSQAGNWEHTNVLRVVKTKEEIAETYALERPNMDETIEQFKAKALPVRETRIRPGLDDKIIAGWNGLALSGLCDAYQALKQTDILELATMNATYLKENHFQNGKLYRFSNKKMEGFLEDYAAVIQSFVKYYETTLEEEYLKIARQLTNRVEEAFFDTTDNLYFFSGDREEKLIARKKELFDNVIPSSNAMMAWNLIHLGTHYYDDAMVTKGKTLVAQVKSLLVQEPEYMSYWSSIALEVAGDFAEIVVVGPEADEVVQEMNGLFLPNKIITGTKSEGSLPPLENKTTIDGQTTIYVCFDKSCKLPVTSVDEALKQINGK